MSLRVGLISELVLNGSHQSQWLDANGYRSCFCIGQGTVAATWIIQAKLPDESIVDVANYAPDGEPLASLLFKAGSGKYCTTNAMCGLPIRFVASVPQPGAKLWAIFKA